MKNNKEGRGECICSSKCIVVSAPDVTYIIHFYRDNLPHVSGITWADMFNETRWIGDLLWRWARRHRSFVVPTLGNHDWVPANAMESKNATLYRGFLNHAGFNQLLPEDAWATFEQGKAFCFITYFRFT